jgi:hypothetical protein
VTIIDFRIDNVRKFVAFDFVDSSNYTKTITDWSFDNIEPLFSIKRGDLEVQFKMFLHKEIIVSIGKRSSKKVENEDKSYLIILALNEKF